MSFTVKGRVKGRIVVLAGIAAIGATLMTADVKADLSQKLVSWVVQSGNDPVEVADIQNAGGWLYNYGPGMAKWQGNLIQPGGYLTVKFDKLIVEHGGGEIFAHGVFIQTHGE